MAFQEWNGKTGGGRAPNSGCMYIYGFEFLPKIRTLTVFTLGGGGGAAPRGDAMTDGPDTTVCLRPPLADDIDRLAQGAGLATSAWVTRILAAAVRSLRTPEERQADHSARIAAVRSYIVGLRALEEPPEYIRAADVACALGVDPAHAGQILLEALPGVRPVKGRGYRTRAAFDALAGPEHRTTRPCDRAGRLPLRKRHPDCPASRERPSTGKRPVRNTGVCCPGHVDPSAATSTECASGQQSGTQSA